MFRQAIRRCATATIPQASARSLQYPTRSISPIIKSKTFATPAIKSSFIRCYSAHAGLNKDEIQGRILDLLKNFDKVSADAKPSGTSHFTKDLGLDSLDTVEVVMAIEEEFSIEIPDKEADRIQSVDQAVEYILSQPDAH